MPAPDAYESIIPDEPIPVAPNPPEVEIDDPVIAGAEVMTIVNRMLNRVPDGEHMLPEMKTWSDNPKTAWYHEAVQEAASEHAYEWIDENVENWTELLKIRDWTAPGKEWVAEYSAEN